MSSIESDVSGARLQLSINAASKMGQVLTGSNGLSPFSAQTSSVQALATATQVVQFNQKEYSGDGPQTFTTLLPDDLHYLNRLTLVVGVPAIANQTQNRVTKTGVNAGVSSITVTDNGSGYDGTAITWTPGAAPSTGLTFAVSETSVPADVVSTIAGFDITITEPGYGYSSAPALTATDGGMSGDPPTFTTTLTSDALGENYRYIVPSLASGRQQAALSSSNSTSLTPFTNLGSAILVESDVVRTNSTVTKSITGITYPSTVDSIYHNSIDGGVQDIAAYFMPYCAYMMVDSAELSTDGRQLCYADGYTLLNKHERYSPQGGRHGRSAHASSDVQQLKQWSLDPDSLWYVDLDFFPSKRPFPLAAAAKTALRLTVKTKPWKKMVINGSGGAFIKQCEITTSGTVVKTVKVEPANTSSVSILSSTQPANTALGTAVAAADFSMVLLMQGYLVSDDALVEMQTRPHRIPITRHVVTDTISAVTADTENQVAKIFTRLPIKALHWTGTLESNVKRNDLANFHGPGDPVTATLGSPQGAVVRPVFDKCQLFANNKAVTIKAGAEYFVHKQQIDHCRRLPDSGPLHIWSHHFCLGSPYDFQFDGYLDTTDVKYFELRFDPDPALFADNTAVLGLDGSASGGSVDGGQTINIRIWAECIDFLVVSNGTVGLQFQ
jgi:hypothetical protein